MSEYVRSARAQWADALWKLPAVSLWGREAVPRVTPLLPPKGEARGAVILCAGGAYQWKEPQEAFPHAKWLNSLGYYAFVLDYQVGQNAPDRALRDVQRAIRLLRHKSGPWRIKKNGIAVLGFSSGGHLAAMASTHFDHGNPAADDPVERESCRPDAQLLCYPHISYAPYIKDDPAFVERFFGPGYTQQAVDRLSAHLYVREDTPPAFLWGMQGDWQFGQRQFSLYADALAEKGVPCSYHIFPGGSHNEGRERASPVWKQWTMLAECWLKDVL